MHASTRRQFLSYSASALALAASGLAGTGAMAAMGPNDKFDLVVKGGEVLDPSQGLRAKRDIGIRFGAIEALEADIPADKALKVLNAGGKLVTPGLIDLHAHVYPYGSAIGIPADELVPYPGDDHHGLGRRRGRQQLRGLPPAHRGADPHPPLRLRAHRQRRPDAVPGARALQHRFRPGRCGGQGGGGERRHRARRQGAHERERHRQARRWSRSSGRSRPARRPAAAPRSCATSAAWRRPS